MDIILEILELYINASEDVKNQIDLLLESQEQSSDALGLQTEMP